MTFSSGGRISQRVELSRSQLQAIGERVSLAQAKIEKIKGSKKAIKVACVALSLWLVGSPRNPLPSPLPMPLRLPAPCFSHMASFPPAQAVWSFSGPLRKCSDSPCTQVFSSAKYPAPERLQEYSSIFTGAQDPGLQRRARHRVQSKHRPLDEQALQV